MQHIKKLRRYFLAAETLADVADAEADAYLEAYLEANESLIMPSIQIEQCEFA